MFQEMESRFDYITLHNKLYELGQRCKELSQRFGAATEEAQKALEEFAAEVNALGEEALQVINGGLREEELSED